MESLHYLLMKTNALFHKRIVNRMGRIGLTAGQPKVLGVRDILLEWIAFRAEFHSHRLFHAFQCGEHLIFERFRERARAEIIHAALGCDRESGGNGESQIGHFRKIGPLPSEKLLHVGSSLGDPLAEEIDIFSGGIRFHRRRRFFRGSRLDGLFLSG